MLPLEVIPPLATRPLATLRVSVVADVFTTRAFTTPLAFFISTAPADVSPLLALKVPPIVR